MSCGSTVPNGSGGPGVPAVPGGSDIQSGVFRTYRVFYYCAAKLLNRPTRYKSRTRRTFGDKKDPLDSLRL